MGIFGPSRAEREAQSRQQAETAAPVRQSRERSARALRDAEGKLRALDKEIRAAGRDTDPRASAYFRRNWTADAKIARANMRDADQRLAERPRRWWQ
jgi:hypothetical protein